MDDPSVRRERVAHTLAVELTRRGLNCHCIEGIGVTVVSVERVISVWVDDSEVRWRVGPDLERWERHPHDDLALAAELILAYVCGRPGAVR